MMHLAIGRRLEGVEGLLGGLLPLKDQYRDCFATFTYRRDLLTLDYCHCHQMYPCLILDTRAKVARSV